MRIRTIKPDFWTNERIAALPEFTQLLAIGLLNWSDDEGYFLASPITIKGAIFPFREDSRSIHGALTELQALDYCQIRLNPVDNREYGKIVNFLKHQVINRPTLSKIKPIFDVLTESSVSTHGALTDGREGKGREKKGREVISASPPVTEIDPQKKPKNFKCGYDAPGIWERLFRLENHLQWKWLPFHWKAFWEIVAVMNEKEFKNCVGKFMKTEDVWIRKKGFTPQLLQEHLGAYAPKQIIENQNGTESAESNICPEHFDDGPIPRVAPPAALNGS